jgi:VWFA-related protein
VKTSYALRLGLLLLSAGLATTPAQEPAQTPATEPSIRVDVNRVHFSVRVTDSRGRFIQGLRREDFQVLDNGKEQPITFLAANEEPAQVVFLIEHGIEDYLLSGIGKNPMVAASDLISRLSPKDRVAIVTFSDHARVALDFTADKIQARQTLAALHNRLVASKAGSIALNLSSSLAATLDWLAQSPGSKTIVLLSTGIDTSPTGMIETLKEKMVTSDVHVLAISVFGEARKPVKGRKLSADEREDRTFVKEGIAESDRWLQQLAKLAGGRCYIPKNAKDFDRAYKEATQFVAGEYVLEFVPPSLDGQLHSLRVKVKRSSYHILHRQSYLAPTPPAH